MSAFEYVIVMVSVVLSLGVAHSLAGFATLLQGSHRVRWSLTHGIWWAVIFSCNLDLWLSLWTVRGQQIWPLGAWLSAFGAACLVYLANYLASPRPAAGDAVIDLWAFHQANRKRYLTAQLGYLLVGMALNATLLPQEFKLANLTTAGPALLGILLAIFIPNRWVQRLIAVVMLGLIAAYYVNFFSELRS
jgi:hypothetical protein